MLVLIVALAAGLQVAGVADRAGADAAADARRIAEVEVVLGRNDRGEVTCATRKSSGLPQIDALICRDSAECFKEVDVTREQINACIRKRKPGLINRIERELNGRGRASGL